MNVYAVDAPVGGRNYATDMSSQLDGNIGHLRRLRASMGKGTPLQAKPVYTGRQRSPDDFTQRFTR